MCVCVCVCVCAHSDCNEYADEEVELVEVKQTRVVHIKHIKHCIYLILAQVSHNLHEHQELDICTENTRTGERNTGLEKREREGGVTIQGHLSSDVDGFEELQYHTHSTSIQQTVGLVQPEVTQGT